MRVFKKLNLVVQKYLPKEEIKLLKKVYIIARDAHKGQIRSSGEIYITHPIAVACILAKMRLEHEILIAALLHDIIEDTSLTFNDIEKLVGTTIAVLVDGVSKLDKFNFRNKKEAQTENLQKIIIAMIKDTRVILIKLADRMHNMRTLDSLKIDKRRRIARETLEIYSPLANKLGISYIKTELEELCFKTLYPKRYKIIKKIIKSTYNNYNELTQKIISDINNQLITVKFKYHINIYKKSIYSIYCKIQQKKNKLYSIIDIYSFLVIVQDIDACYQVLGKIHGLYKPRPGQIKDYIAIPKVNGYQSLHTSLIGPKGIPFKIQIRTEDMHKTAKIGIASNWVYKKQKQKSFITELQIKKWMKNLLELQQTTENSYEFIESLKSDLFPKEIYVFTPKGHIVELPIGSTPIDFAYAVHTDIGHTCIGALINYQTCQLSQPLLNGQTIEIITSKKSKPNAAWLNFIVSSKAKTKIRNLLKNLKRKESVNIEKKLFKHVLKTNTNLCKINKINIDMGLYKKELNLIDNLLVKINFEKTINLIITHNIQNNSNLILKNNNKIFTKNTKNILIEITNHNFNTKIKQAIYNIKTDNFNYNYNNNCNFFSKKNNKISNISNYDINLPFIIEIKVNLINIEDTLTNLISIINKINLNINKMNSIKKNDIIYYSFIQIFIKNHIQLNNLINAIRIIPNVLQINKNNIF